MRDRAARNRIGLNIGTAPLPGSDRRIHVDIEGLRALEGRAKALSFLPRQQARSVLNGRHASRLRGRGLNFEELRGYLPGDDVRTIDWKVTARTGEPHVRVYTEERDRPALIVVDQRMSMFFGSRLNMKSVTAAEAAAMAAFRVLHQGDRVGGIVFGDEHIAELKPQRNRRALDRFLSSLVEANRVLNADAPECDTMPLDRVLTSVARIARRDHLVMIMSDFDGVSERTRTLVSGLARHNDLILFLVSDPMGHELPKGARLIVSDGGLQAELNTGSGTVHRAVTDFATGRMAEILDWQRSLGVPVLPISAGEDTVSQVRRLMGFSTAGRP